MGIQDQKIRQQSFGERLKSLRIERRLTRAQLAAEVGVSNVAIWQWEADRRQPTTKSLLRLAAALDVSPDFLRIGMEVAWVAELASPAAFETLESIIAMVRPKIAQAAGVNEDQVRITITA